MQGPRLLLLCAWSACTVEENAASAGDSVGDAGCDAADEDDEGGDGGGCLVNAGSSPSPSPCIILAAFVWCGFVCAETVLKVPQLTTCTHSTARTRTVQRAKQHRQRVWRTG